MLQAVAVDPAGGPITEVEFLSDGVVVARSDLGGQVFPAVIGLKVLHRAVWDAPTPGIHLLEAQALRERRTVARSEAVRVVVGGEPPPVDPPLPQGTVVDLVALDPVALESAPEDLLTVEFRRTGDLARPLRVYFKLGGSADWSNDLRVVPGGLKPEALGDPTLAPWMQSVVIPAGAPAGKLVLAPIPDDKAEGDEFLALSVVPPPVVVKEGTDPSDYLVGGSPGTRLLIRDSARPTPSGAPLVRMRGVQASTSEPGPLVRIRPGGIVVQRDGDVGEPLRVRYAVGGTARNGEDYSLLDGDLTLGAGETEGELQVVALQDALLEPEETVVLKLLEDPSYRVDSASASAQVTIADTTGPDIASLRMVAPSVAERVRVGAEVTLRVVAVDPSGYLPEVTFWADGRPIGDSRLQFFRAPDPGTPLEHALVWKVDSEGPLRLQATALDSRGRKLATEAVVVVGVAASDRADRSFHPADASPADHWISDLEWMACAKHWRHGVPLTQDAGLVSISDLTRAGFLWRSGGGYQVDPLAEAFPMGWIPPGVAPGNAASLGTNGTPERPSASYALLEVVPGAPGTLAVTVHLGPAANTRCQAAELRLGAGATLSGISDEGQWDPVGGVLRWGPFLDDTVRALKAVVVGVDASAVSAVGSLDGEDTPVSALGARSSGVGPATSVPRLAALRTAPQGEARLVLLGGSNGSQVDLEVSEDMVTWRRIANVLVTGESKLQVDNDAGGAPLRFYRVVPRGR